MRRLANDVRAVHRIGSRMVRQAAIRMRCVSAVARSKRRDACWSASGRGKPRRAHANSSCSQACPVATDLLARVWKPAPLPALSMNAGRPPTGSDRHMVAPFGACRRPGIVSRRNGSTQGRKQTSTAWRAPMSSSRTGRSSAKAVPSRRMSSLRTSGLPRWHSTRANGRPRSASTPPVCGLFQAASTRTPTSKNPTHACSKDSRPAARPRPPVGSSVVEMPQAHPTTITPELLRQQRLVEQNAVVDMALWGGVIGPPEQTVSDLDEMAGEGAARSSRSWPRRHHSSRPSITRNCCGRCARPHVSICPMDFTLRTINS